MAKMKTILNYKEKHWFIEPTKELPNDKIYNNMVAMKRSFDTRSIQTADGKRHEVWEVDYPFILYLVNQGASPKIFLQLGDAVQNWRLLDKDIRQKEKAKKMLPETPVKEVSDGTKADCQQKTRNFEEQRN